MSNYIPSTSVLWPSLMWNKVGLYGFGDDLTSINLNSSYAALKTSEQKLEHKTKQKSEQNLERKPKQKLERKPKQKLEQKLEHNHIPPILTTHTFWQFIDSLDFSKIREATTSKEASLELRRMWIKIKRTYGLETFTILESAYLLLRNQLLEKFTLADYTGAQWPSWIILEGQKFYYSILYSPSKRSAGEDVEKIKGKYLNDNYCIDLENIWKFGKPEIMNGFLCGDSCCWDCGMPLLTEGSRIRTIVGGVRRVICSDCEL